MANIFLLTCSAVGLASGSFCKQASINEQKSGENLCSEGEGDGSSNIWLNRREYLLGIRKQPSQNQLNAISQTFIVLLYAIRKRTFSFRHSLPFLFRTNKNLSIISIVNIQEIRYNTRKIDNYTNDSGITF